MLNKNLMIFDSMSHNCCSIEEVYALHFDILGTVLHDTGYYLWDSSKGQYFGAVLMAIEGNICENTDWIFDDCFSGRSLEDVLEKYEEMRVFKHFNNEFGLATHSE